jgi:hypothetical protein
VLADVLARDGALFCDHTKIAVCDPEQRRRFLEREDGRRVLTERDSANDETVVGREMMTHRVLDKSPFALAGALSGVVESLCLICRQAHVQGDIIMGHLADDISRYHLRS